MKKIYLLILTVLLLVLTGCSALETAVKKRNLDVQTQVSETIWLDPELIGDRTVFVQVKNTSTANIDIENQIKQLLESKGYIVTNNAKKANYWLQANILKLGKDDLRDGNDGSSGLLGAGVGAAVGAYNTGSMNTAIGLGVLGGIIGTVADAMVSDTQYVMITDVVVSERTPHKVSNKINSYVTQGTNGRTTNQTSFDNNMNRYQTRVKSVANQVNLKLEEAEPQLQKELIKAIGNIF